MTLEAFIPKALHYCDPSLTLAVVQLESLLSLWYTAEPTLWSSVLTMRNKLEPWLTAGSTAPFAPFISPQVSRTM